jgi:hypothetical protein
VTRLHGKVLLPDSVHAPSDKANVRAHLVTASTLGRRGAVFARWTGPDGRARLLPAAAWRDAAHVRPPQVSVGPNPLVVVGNPYSRYAFEKARAVLHIIPRDRPVTLVDAAMAVGPRPADPGGLRRCVAALAARGEVAFFHAGSRREYEAARAAVREAFPGLPVVFAPSAEPTRQGPSPDSLKYARRRLGRSREGGLRVVTGDAVLADLAAGGGFETHLITPVAPTAAPERLRHWPSLDACVASFGAGRP